MQKAIKSFILLLACITLTGCGSSSELSAQEKRNNFDACRIEFLAQVPQNAYSSDTKYFEKQADENCGKLLTLNANEAAGFVPKKPVLPAASVVTTSMKDVCKLVTSAAYAHNEFNSDAVGETIEYDVWYARIQSYFKKAAVVLRKMDGDNSTLISAAEQASLNARGVNAGRLTPGEELLYSTCNISEDKVTADFERWGGF